MIVFSTLLWAVSLGLLFGACAFAGVMDGRRGFHWADRVAFLVLVGFGLLAGYGAFTTWPAR